MSYLVLARKSRPQDFDQVVGQIPVVKTLQNSLIRERVAHAILFSGVRGVGKTTLARIMAKAINCEKGPAKNPCNSCPSCLEITAGSALDLYEIDGASNRGIQEIRELKEKIRFLPTSLKYKIIIIDEVHMLTTEAFNALLKTLEEPPKHVFFMFATTELHKIPITILSRCQRYELKRVSAPELSTHFQRLAQEEGVAIDPAALDLIVRESEGSVRDGLSLLDQVFSYGEATISIDDVIQVLGLVSRDIILKLTRALLEKDSASAFQALNETFSFGVDLKRFTNDLLAAFRTLILCRIEGCQELIDIPPQELALFHELAKNHSPQTIHMKLNLLMQGVEEMRYSSQPRLVLESSFLKIIQADEVVAVSSLLGKIDTLLQGKTLPKSTPSAPPVEVKKKQQSPDPTPQPHPETKPTPTPVTSLSKEQMPPPLIEEQPPLPEEESLPKQEENKSIPRPHQRDVRRDWPGFIEHVKDRKLWMAQDLQRADSTREVDGELQLRFSDPANCTLLRQKENVKLLTEFVLDFFQKDLRLHFITPDQREDEGTQNNDSPHKLRQRLANDPLVLMATEIFNGQIGDIRVGPRSR
ncbi:MAG: DNA polymerase III subunit gamma/tau [Proteobacteria bacterium]|nr:DNA polymerase III subunit gamma/tau [Pseudomonadota bacterium]MBU1058010.1 DNA polymerase III subunit gamma/tau [Pseudomonadota bacterium]